MEKRTWSKSKLSFLQNNLLRIGAIEISVDGYLADKTAALIYPYSRWFKLNWKIIVFTKVFDLFCY